MTDLVTTEKIFFKKVADWRERNTIFCYYLYMNVIYTSISLPESVKARLKCYIAESKLFLDQYLLKRLDTVGGLVQARKKNRARCYNRSEEEFEKMSVYWSEELYNRLHFVAYHLRISVSLLIFYLLEIDDIEVKKPSGNYRMATYYHEDIGFFSIEFWDIRCFRRPLPP